MGILDQKKAQINAYWHGNEPRYRVTTAAVVVELANGAEQYIYRKEWLPLGVAPSTIEHLLRQELIEPIGGAQ